MRGGEEPRRNLSYPPILRVKVSASMRGGEEPRRNRKEVVVLVAQSMLQ